MKSIYVLIIAASSLLIFSDASAQRIRLSDTLSPQQNYSLDLALQPHELTRLISVLLNDEESPLPPLRGFLPGVEIRLDTSNYVDQRVRIYLVLPATIVAGPGSGGLQLSWEATGVFLPGSVRVGQEALLFEGELNSPITSGTFNFTLLVESDGLQDSFSIEPYYELEILF
jgi:hypothetical protein